MSLCVCVYVCVCVCVYVCVLGKVRFMEEQDNHFRVSCSNSMRNNFVAGKIPD